MISEVNIETISYNGNGELPTAHLTDDGQNLVLNTNNSGYYANNRVLSLHWVAIDYESNQVEFIELLFKRGNEDFGEVVVDLSIITTVPRFISSNVLSRTIDIDLFTYEANIDTTYGSKRLSVPYKISTPANMVMPKSTDGVFLLSYISVDSSKLDDDIRTDIIACSPQFNKYGGELMTFYAGVSVTRFFKQSMFAKTLSTTSFKKADDLESIQLLNKLNTLYKSCNLKLRNRDFIRAQYELYRAEEIYKQQERGTFNPSQIKVNYTI